VQSGLLLAAFGCALAFRAGVGVAITFLMRLVMLARIEAEEPLLGKMFGAEYDAYRARSWRLLPYVY
jgi:protein-S-isoprenylcysteine O-methyltransferase Ste14